MKLRIRGNSIRFRLTRGEVERFADTGLVEDSLDLGNGRQTFSYVLESGSGGPELQASFEAGALRVVVPDEIAKQWARSDQVGIESSPGNIPRILIEKDFTCLTERAGEDESDMFPHPAEAVCHPGKD